MGRFIDAVKAGVSGMFDDDAREYEMAGRPVKCAHCGERKFVPSSALLNTRALTFFNFDWANSGATLLICAECGRIEWFLHEPTEK
jgi:hypothetical protein